MVLVACCCVSAQGNLQVFHQDLPLSIQDGYESFLSSSSVSLQQYQVQVQTRPMTVEGFSIKTNHSHGKNSKPLPSVFPPGVWPPEETGLCGAQIRPQVTTTSACDLTRVGSQMCDHRVCLGSVWSRRTMPGSSTCLRLVSGRHGSRRGSAAQAPAQRLRRPPGEQSSHNINPQSLLLITAVVSVET